MGTAISLEQKQNSPSAAGEVCAIGLVVRRTHVQIVVLPIVLVLPVLTL